MNFFSDTDKGCVRETNQDACYVANINDEILFAVVCDGMGGTRGGDVASNTTVNFLVGKIPFIEKEIIAKKDVKDLMKELVKEANTLVRNKALEDEELDRMGTTLVFSIIYGDKLYIANVGDSRAYIIRDGVISQLTRDHSIVQEMLDSGEITREQAKAHPQKNIITRALGVSNKLDVDCFIHNFLKNDSLLMCTDGLSNELSEDEILDRVISEDGSNAVDLLIEDSNARGGKDNITVVLIKN